MDQAPSATPSTACGPVLLSVSQPFVDGSESYTQFPMDADFPFTFTAGPAWDHGTVLQDMFPEFSGSSATADTNPPPNTLADFNWDHFVLNSSAADISAVSVEPSIISHVDVLSLYPLPDLSTGTLSVSSQLRQVVSNGPVDDSEPSTVSTTMFDTIKPDIALQTSYGASAASTTVVQSSVMGVTDPDDGSADSSSDDEVEVEPDPPGPLNGQIEGDIEYEPVKPRRKKGQSVPLISGFEVLNVSFVKQANGR